MQAAVVLCVFAHLLSQQFALIFHDDFFLFAQVDFLAHDFVLLLDLLLFGEFFSDLADFNGLDVFDFLVGDFLDFLSLGFIG